MRRGNVGPSCGRPWPYRAASLPNAHLNAHLLTAASPRQVCLLRTSTPQEYGIRHVASQGPCTAIHHPDSVLDGMNDWCKEHHGKSGLTQRVRDSTVSMAEAEEALLDFISRHTEEGMAQLAGNSVHVGLGSRGAGARGQGQCV